MIIGALLVPSCNQSSVTPTSDETMCSFRVKTEPVGADVYLLDQASGEVLLGTTSIDYITVSLPVGHYEFVLKKEGYEDFPFNKHLQEGENAAEFVALVPYSPPTASCWVHGIPESTTAYFDGEKMSDQYDPDQPASIWLDNLSVGLHTVRFEKDGYYPLEVRFNLTPNTLPWIEYSLNRIDHPTLTHLAIKAVDNGEEVIGGAITYYHPGAGDFIPQDNYYMGTPYTITLPLAAKTTVRLDMPGYPLWEKEIQLSQPNETLTIDLTPPPPDD